MARHHKTTTATDHHHNNTGTYKETGLLTKCVPNSLKHSKIYRLWLRLTRVLQFLSAVISLGIFSSRVYKVYRLVNSVKAQRGINGSMGAVEGILAAAVLYTIIATIMMCLLRGGRGPTWLRWLWVLLDILFVGAFIAVAVLTRPTGGPAGPKHCYSPRNQSTNLSGQGANRSDQSCNLPWGTFILAIISTLLHATTAAFHEVPDHYRHNKGDFDHEDREVKTGHHEHNGLNGQNGLNGHGNHNGNVPVTNGRHGHV